MGDFPTIVIRVAPCAPVATRGPVMKMSRLSGSKALTSGRTVSQ